MVNLRKLFEEGVPSEGSLYSFTLEEPPNAEWLFKLSAESEWPASMDVPEEVRSMMSENFVFWDLDDMPTVYVNTSGLDIYIGIMVGAIKDWSQLKETIIREFGRAVFSKILEHFEWYLDTEETQLHSETDEFEIPTTLDISLEYNITTNLDYILIDGVEVKEENREKIEEIIFKGLVKELYTGELPSSEELQSSIETAVERGDLESAQHATEVLIDYNAIKDLARWIVDGHLSTTSQVITITMPRCLLSLWEACKGSRTNGEFVKELLLEYGVNL